MKFRNIFAVLAVLILGPIHAQNLHSHANAASPTNETNTTTGWTGLANISSISGDSQSGNFALRAVSTANNGRTISYSFPVVIGQDYVIRIWAKNGTRIANNSTAAFAVWSGLSGMETTVISGSEWREYVFNVRATASNATLVAYTHALSFPAVAGNTILIDSVSIFPAGASDNQAPSAPTNLSASGTTTSTTNLSWTASTDNVGVTGYNILRNGMVIGNTNGATNFSVTGLNASTSYSFNVTARDAAGNFSSPSNPVNVTTLTPADTQPPTVPTGLTSNQTTTTSTNLSWIASSDNVGVTGYSVFRGSTMIGETTGATTFSVTELTQNTTYSFSVSAKDLAGNISARSAAISVTTLTATDTQAPTAPSNLTATGTTSSTTTLTWTASTDNTGVTGYNILNNGIVIGSTTGELTYGVTGLSPNTSYGFTVTARDAAGNISPASNSVNITTSASTAFNYTSENANLPTVDWTGRDLFAGRNIGIGTTETNGYRLAIAGSMVAEEINVKLQVNWPDYVFENQYRLPTLEEVERHITEKGYLINMPSAVEVEKQGIEIGEMSAKLLEKIEELTLYILSQQKQIKALELENEKVHNILEKILDREQIDEQ